MRARIHGDHGSRTLGQIRRAGGRERLASAVARVVAVTAAVFAVAGGSFSAASASGLPVSDTYANGYLGICDRSGNQITQGDIGAHPPFWLIVSTVPAPNGSTHDSVYGYQPIPVEDPSNWSGELLTVTAEFSNPQHPMAAGTVADGPLTWFLNDYPPKWNGLVQLRMFFSGGRAGFIVDRYPEAFLQVKGSTWTQLDPPKVDCKSGTATSDLAIGTPASQLRTTPVTFGAASPAGRGSSPSGVTTHSGGAGQPSSTSGQARSSQGGNRAEAAGASKSDRSGGSWVWPLLFGLLAAAALTGGAVWFWRRHRRSPGDVVGAVNSRVDDAADVS